MNSIHSTAVIADDVVMGSDNTIGPFVVIAAGTVLGDGNWVGSGTVLGSPPEVRSHPHTAAWLDGAGQHGLVIGNGNVFREAVQVSRGWAHESSIGDGTFIMNRTYLGHDCAIGDDVTIASGASLGGHVTVQRGANLGLATTVHQRRVIGAYAMVGMGAVITRDVLPFTKSFGSPSTARGINAVGMTRAGFADDDVAWALATLANRADLAGIVGPASVSRYLDDFARATAQA